MSFRGDDSRRYGHVPPAQYPVANESQDQSSYSDRRPSYNTGDDSTFYDAGSRRQQQNYPGGGGEELFLASPTESHGSQGRQSYANASPAMAGYQHQYQGHNQAASATSHSAYNPQHFAQPSTAHLPQRPRYSSPTSPTYGQAPSVTTYSQVPAYNPAAYANTNGPQRNPSTANHSYSYQYSSPSIPQTPTFAQPASAPLPPQPNYGSPAPAAHYGQPASAASTPYDSSYFASYGGQQHAAYPANGHNASPNPPTAGFAAQPPHQGYVQIPVGPMYSSSDPNSFMNRTSRSNSQESSSPVVHNQPSTGLQRHPTNAPLPNRPMEDVAEEPSWEPTQTQYEDEFGPSTQESLINNIVSNLRVSGSSSRPPNGEFSDDDMDPLQRYNSSASTIANDASTTGVNRYASTASTLNQNEHQTSYDYDDDESDPEAVMGLMAMQEAAMDDRRFSSLPTYIEPPLTPQPPPQADRQESSDSDFGGMDLGMYGGGYAGNLQYGNDISTPPATASTQDGGRPRATSQGYANDPPYPVYSEASVDYGGTGGLQPPQIHRLSFDDGDEEVSVHSRLSGSESPSREDYPDMFYHPGISNRPLPALPPGADDSSLLSVQAAHRGPYQHGYSLSADSRPLYQIGTAEAYQGQYQQQVERSISLSSHSNTPQVQAPARSRTDAAEERRKMRHINQQQQLLEGYDGYDTGTPPSLAYDVITLPSGRKRKFIPSKLSPADFKRCAEPWALSSIVAWIREMTEFEDYISKKTIEEGIVKLFSAKVPTMNVADAEVLSSMVMDSMLAAGILKLEEAEEWAKFNWAKFETGSISGVLWQLTGSGCYAPKVHENEAQSPRLHDHGIPVRCYSYHCGRTLKKANLDHMMSEEDIKTVGWAEFYGLTGAEIEKKPKKEVERQNVLHEIITGEEEYMNQLDVLRLLYRDQLKAWQPPIISANRLDKFVDAVFGKVDAVQQINKEHLLAQLKYRQKEQGPWIIGFSDLFREWIRRARPVYVDFCSAFPHAQYLVRREAERNLLFRQFLDIVRDHKRSKRLEWTTFIKAPITRLQRYSLLLDTARKHMVGDSEEKANLTRALEEIRAVTHECDEKVDEMSKKVALLELQSMLVLRPGFQSVLNLDHLGRQLLKAGDLQRQGSKGVRWVDTHALLFDHYFVLAKAVVSKDGRGDKKYDVSKEPIPMPLLFLESINDDPVSKQKGITAPLARTSAATASSTQLNKVMSNGNDRPGLEHTPTNSSIGSLNTVTRLTPAGSNDTEGKIIYPFRIKHLGHEVYTLYASSLQDRNDWCAAIIEAKTRHAKALYAQSAEPFRLRVLSDSAFAYDSVTAITRQPGVAIEGTPLDRAIREMATIYKSQRSPPPVCRAQVNCACAFNAFGKSLIAIGTDYGVYISESSNPRGWTRSVQINRVTQIAVLEEFSICLIIADKSLISYPLDVVAPVSNFPAPGQDNSRRAPQRLAKDVAFFATARMKERMLLFYKRKEGMHNTFKVLEPVFQRSSEKKTRIFGGRSKGGFGGTESFRDFDEFYLPTECFSLNLFQTYVAVASAKGFELLTLDKKIPQSIPRDLSLPAIANIASRIRDQRPLGMFKLNDQEFLLTYEDCAVYVDKHGEVSRTLIMEYSGKQKKAKGATMYGPYLLLFNEDYVEVRNAENGRLRQIIAGRDVRCLDYGFRGPTGGGIPIPPIVGQVVPGPEVTQDTKSSVKICMSHPELPGGQIVLEMLLNAEGKTKETGM